MTTKAQQGYHLAKYGEEFLVEAEGLDFAGFEMIKAGLPAEIQAKVFGWRNLTGIPHGEGEKYISHPFDTLPQPAYVHDGKVRLQAPAASQNQRQGVSA